MDGLLVGTGSLVPTPGAIAEALDCDLKFTISGESTWCATTTPCLYEYDSAESGSPPDGGESCLQAIVESDSSETIKFHWKVSSEQNAVYLQFHINGLLQMGPLKRVPRMPTVLVLSLVFCKKAPASRRRGML